MEGKMTVITGDKQIALYRLVVLRGALKLEIVGMRRRGKSASKILKDEFGLKGKKAEQLVQLEKLIEDAKAEI